MISASFLVLADYANPMNILSDFGFDLTSPNWNIFLQQKYLSDQFTVVNGHDSDTIKEQKEDEKRKKSGEKAKDETNQYYCNNLLINKFQ